MGINQSILKYKTVCARHNNESLLMMNDNMDLIDVLIYTLNRHENLGRELSKKGQMISKQIE